jgi:hypothetical protein
MIAVPVRCLRCGGWKLRSPRRYAPRWMRNAPALAMAGGIQIASGGLTIASGGVIVTDADGTPCCCVSSSSSSSSSGSGSGGSASASATCPTDCTSCPGSYSCDVKITPVDTPTAYSEMTGTITKSPPSACGWAASSGWTTIHGGCAMITGSLSCGTLTYGWTFIVHSNCGDFTINTTDFGACPPSSFSLNTGPHGFIIDVTLT